ncbi:MAG: ester cyclase [Caldilineaceae bacterium]
MKNYINHNAVPGEAPERAGLTHFVLYVRAAFRDLNCMIDDQIAEGDKVTTRWDRHWHPPRPLCRSSRPPAKRWRSPPSTSIASPNGQIQEGWLNWDALGFLQQVGAFPD